MKIFLILILYIINIVSCLEESKSTIVFINAKENALLAKSKKPVLRYGFHRTEECKRFDQAFICIQKCIDLNYDVAHADRNCRCTCYTKQERAKYKPVSPATKTRWRSGPPKTSIPYWANPAKENKTRGEESGSEEAVTGDDAGTGVTEGTDSTNQAGGETGTGATGAADAGGTGGTGATDSGNASQGSGATGEGATGEGATGGGATGDGVTQAAEAATT